MPYCSLQAKDRVSVVEHLLCIAKGPRFNLWRLQVVVGRTPALNPGEQLPDSIENTQVDRHDNTASCASVLWPVGTKGERGWTGSAMTAEFAGGFPLPGWKLAFRSYIEWKGGSRCKGVSEVGSAFKAVGHFSQCGANIQSGLSIVANWKYVQKGWSIGNVDLIHTEMKNAFINQVLK